MEVYFDHVALVLNKMASYSDFLPFPIRAR